MRAVGPRAKIRPPKVADVQFIVDSWAKSWRDKLGPYEKEIAPHSLFVDIIAVLMKGAAVKVAVDAEDNICGWLAGVPARRRVLYAYVRNSQRGDGCFIELAQAMFDTKEGLEIACPASGGFFRHMKAKYGAKFSPDFPYLVGLVEKV